MGELMSHDGIAKRNRGAGITVAAHIGHQRNLRQELDSKLLGQLNTTLLAEDIIALAGMLRRSEPGHIFHKPQNGHIHFFAGKHGYPLAGIGQSHLLRG